MIEVYPATEAECRWVGQHLRDEDRQEVSAATGGDPVAVLLESRRNSSKCFAVYPQVGGFPCALFGSSPDPNFDGVGIVWMLCTPEVAQEAKSVLQVARTWVDVLGADYPRGLHNLVWAKNRLHVRWCRVLGFKEQGTIEHRGHEFIHIYRPQAGTTYV